MALTEIRPKWFVIQENSQAGTAIKSGPFFEELPAIEACKIVAAQQQGVAFSVVKVITGFTTGDTPVVKLKFTQPAGSTSV